MITTKTRGRLVVAALVCSLASITAACAGTDSSNIHPMRALQPAEVQALVDLTVVIECRATSDVEQQVSSNAWKIALDSPAEASPGYQAWKIAEQDDSSIREVELPGEITVFGYKTNRLAITADAFLAVLHGESVEKVGAKLGLVRHEEPMFAHIYSKPLSLRNGGEDGIHLRGLTAVEVATDKGMVMVGCESRHDTRSDQLRRRGKETPQDLAPGVDISQFLEKVMSCEATALENSSAGWDLALWESRNDQRYVGWRGGRDEDDNRWWTPPAPLTINGEPVTRILKLGSTLYAEQDGEVAGRLAKEWQLDMHEADGNEVMYAQFYEPSAAEDGWNEQRTRIVRQWQPGKTLHGCQYEQKFPEFGSTPDDEVDEGSR
jgi:hypothetical protein